MRPISNARRTLGLTLACLALAGSALAQTPARVTRIIVAFPPGGPVDFVARTVGEGLSKELGHQVVIENKAGGNGAIAAEFLARSPADGSTLWLTSVGAVAINPALYDKLAYDPVRDLVPVSLVVNNVEVLVVGAKAPYNTGAEFVAAARQQTAKPLTMASSGTGGVPHLAAEPLNEACQNQLAARARQRRRARADRRDRRPCERLFWRHPGPDRLRQIGPAQGHRHGRASAPPAAARRQDL